MYIPYVLPVPGSTSVQSHVNSLWCSIKFSRVRSVYFEGRIIRREVCRLIVFTVSSLGGTLTLTRLALSLSSSITQVCCSPANGATLHIKPPNSDANTVAASATAALIKLLLLLACCSCCHPLFFCCTQLTQAIVSLPIVHHWPNETSC